MAPKAASAPSASSDLDFKTYFGDVEDPRIDRGKEHKLLDIIGLTICAVVAGADDFTAIERFGKARKQWLSQFLELKNGIPSHDTIGNVWSRVDPGEFEVGFRRWIGRLTDKIEGVVAVDGKTLRGSHDREDNKAALEMIDVWACEQEVVLGQEAIPEETNETGALPEMLRLLEVEGAIVTLDAAGCYSDILEEIIAQGADYLTTLKANQKTLYNDAKAIFDRREAVGELPETSGLEVHKEVDGGHDRVEIRRCQAIDIDGRELSSAEGWPGLKTLCKVEAERHHPDGTIEKEERLFITSLEADPKKLLKTVRSHWHVENKLHWRLDVAFQEDASRVRKGHAAQNLGVVRRLALTLLKQETSRSVGTKTKRMEAGWNPDYLLKVLTSGN